MYACIAFIDSQQTAPAKSISNKSRNPLNPEYFPTKVATKKLVNEIVVHCPNTAGPGSEIQLTSPLTGKLLKIIVPENTYAGYYFIYTEDMTEEEKLAVINHESELAKDVGSELMCHDCCVFCGGERTAKMDQWTKVRKE